MAAERSRVERLTNIEGEAIVMHDLCKIYAAQVCRVPIRNQSVFSPNSKPKRILDRANEGLMEGLRVFGNLHLREYRIANLPAN